MRRTLHVDGRLVQSEPNTPAGRQAIDKAALLASETSDDVRVGGSPAAMPDSGVAGANALADAVDRGTPGATGPGWPGQSVGLKASDPKGPHVSTQLRRQREVSRTRFGRGGLSDLEAPPTLAPCCEPETYPGPSGVRKRHSFSCPNHPGQPIGAVTAQVRDISAGRLARQHRAQTLRTGLDDAIAEHPASYVSAETHALIHPGEDAYECPECSDRRTS